MKISEIKNLTPLELNTKLHEVQEELFNLRFQFTIGQAKNPNRLTELKRDVARIKTVLREQELKQQA
jgi:large subunit ribosomal protein L29